MSTQTGVRKVEPQSLEASAWAPFGWLPVDDTDPSDGRQTLEFAWSDPHVNIIGHTLDELTEVPGGLRCEAMYRHATHTQTIMPLDHPAVIAVAPADSSLAGASDLDDVRVFLVRPLESFVLHRGTWHWGPYPTDTASVRLFNVQGLRYAEDNEKADLAERGLSFDVALDRPA